MGNSSGFALCSGKFCISLISRAYNMQLSFKLFYSTWETCAPCPPLAEFNVSRLMNRRFVDCCRRAVCTSHCSCLKCSLLLYMGTKVTSRIGFSWTNWSRAYAWHKRCTCVHQLPLSWRCRRVDRPPLSTNYQSVPTPRSVRESLVRDRQCRTRFWSLAAVRVRRCAQRRSRLTAVKDNKWWHLLCSDPAADTG